MIEDSQITVIDKELKKLENEERKRALLKESVAKLKSDIENILNNSLESEEFSDAEKEKILKELDRFSEYALYDLWIKLSIFYNQYKYEEVKKKEEVIKNFYDIVSDVVSEINDVEKYKMLKVNWESEKIRRKKEEVSKTKNIDFLDLKKALLKQLEHFPKYALIDVMSEAELKYYKNLFISDLESKNSPELIKEIENYKSMTLEQVRNKLF